MFNELKNFEFIYDMYFLYSKSNKAQSQSFNQSSGTQQIEGLKALKIRNHHKCNKNHTHHKHHTPPSATITWLHDCMIAFSFLCRFKVKTFLPSDSVE